MPITIITLFLHIFIGSTLAGAGVIAALSLGYDGVRHILSAAAVGFVLGVPISWYVARRIVRQG